jgi:hypothetical protein
MYKNDDIITIGSGSEERSIAWTIKNIRLYDTGQYYTCGVCKVQNTCCDLESDDQETITIDTGSINEMVEINDQHEPSPISFWKTDIFKIPGDE